MLSTFLQRACILCGLLLLPLLSNADSLSFSITPTIFDMAAMPSQSWTSAVKVVNNNPYELTVYAAPVNFEPRGERGHGSFVPLDPNAAAGATLAEWMHVSSEAIVIPAESSVAVPVSIQVPADAAPGGHYAAIMIGTRPPEKNGEFQIKTSQIIASLFFLRIAGDVVEKGEVRTFRADRRFTEKPEMSFSVRFENEGNVHLVPQGEIVIKNMWGKERGIIPINRETNFGNVLPQSIRLFSFSWRGEASLLDIGRYQAELTLAYGQDGRKFVTRSAIFWVIPLKPVLVFLSSIILAAWFITRSVRAYVRYMLRMSGIDLDQQQALSHRPRHILHEGDVRIERTVSVQAPVRAGITDLRSRLRSVRARFEIFGVFLSFIKAYPRFFLSAAGFIVLFSALWWYLASVNTAQRDYEVTIDGTTPVTISSEEILQDRAPAAVTSVIDTATTTTEQTYTLAVVNAASTPGLGGMVADQLTAKGYTITDLRAELEVEKKRSVIVYDPSLEATALALSDTLGGVLLSAFSDGNVAKPGITIYLGNDYTTE